MKSCWCGTERARGGHPQGAGCHEANTCCSFLRGGRLADGRPGRRVGEVAGHGMSACAVEHEDQRLSIIWLYSRRWRCAFGVWSAARAASLDPLCAEIRVARRERLWVTETALDKSEARALCGPKPRGEARARDRERPPQAQSRPKSEAGGDHFSVNATASHHRPNLCPRLSGGNVQARTSARSTNRRGRFDNSHSLELGSTSGSITERIIPGRQCRSVAGSGYRGIAVASSAV